MRVFKHLIWVFFILFSPYSFADHNFDGFREAQFPYGAPMDPGTYNEYTQDYYSRYNHEPYYDTDGIVYRYYYDNNGNIMRFVTINPPSHWKIRK